MTVSMQEADIIGRHHRWENRYTPDVPIRETVKLFDIIPDQGLWQLPEPWHILEKEDPEGFRVKWDVMLSMWIQYLDNASKGLQIFNKAVKEGDISVEVEVIDAANYFYNAGFETKGYEEKTAKVLSVRRAFAALMSKEQQKRMAMKDDEILVSDDDVRNARTLVRNFEFKIYFHRSLIDDED